MCLFFLHRSAAVAVLTLALAAAAQARELGNFDINAVQRAKAAPRGVPGNVDAIGRATFTWERRGLEAGAKVAPGDAVAAARAHIRGLLGAGSKSAAADVTDVLRDPRVDAQFGGAQLVRFTPRLDGIEILQEGVALLLDRYQGLVAIRGPLPQDTLDSAKALPAFDLSAAEAIAVALGHYEFDAEVARQLERELRKDGGEYLAYRLPKGYASRSGATSNELQRARKVWFRTRSGLEPAWYVEIQVSDAPGASTDGYAFVVSARGGRVLLRHNQTEKLQEFTYRVWADAGPSFTPYPSPEGRGNSPDFDGLPTDNELPPLTPQPRTLANLAFSRAGTDGWLPDDATDTRGNNVDAYADLVAPDGFGPGDLRPTTTASHRFDYPYSTSLGPNAGPDQIHTGTLQAFFWVNWLHDFFYDRGFTELDGNAQGDNKGRGGLQHDAMRVETQDYASFDGASMRTPADGSPPRMRLGVTRQLPTKDTAVTAVVAHEWGHYLSNRLIADSVGLNAQHAHGIGEGWADTVAMLIVATEADRLRAGNESWQGPYALHSYVGHSYYGRRRYPFTPDPGKNPLSLRHIVEGVPLPTSPAPFFGQNGVANTEVHRQGEIWSSALWDAYVALLDEPLRDFASTQARMAEILVASMKLTPVDPTMPEARDAILATLLANGASREYELFVAAFARRGLGAGALVPDRYSSTMQGTQESFSATFALAASDASLGVPIGCDADTQLDVGEQASLAFSIRNTGFVRAGNVVATVTASDPAVTFPQGNTVTIGELDRWASRRVSLPVALSAEVRANSPITFTVTPSASGPSGPPASARLEILASFDETANASTSEEFDGTVKLWSSLLEPQGDGDSRWTRRSEGARSFFAGSDRHSGGILWAVSPRMSSSASAPTVLLRHRFGFQAGVPGDYFDGGLVQVSVDDGSTWADVDHPAAARLSNCCGNPAAERRGFVGTSTGYPQFVDHALQLGAAYANQPRLRLRFGIATDNATALHGWDIDRITVNGVTEPPFSLVSLQAASCASASYRRLQGALSGTYYSAARSGEGVLVDFGQVGSTPVAFFSWYTYEGGEQQWLVGSAPFSTGATAVALDLFETSGARFGSQFRSQDVVDTLWGSAALSFPTCDTLQLTYQKLSGESGTLILERGLSRLEPAQCNVLHGGLSGTYYSAQRSGEGVLVDFGKAGNDPVEFFTWYTYEDGQQRWLVGSKRFAPGDASISIDLIDTSGAQFGNLFRPQDVVATPWGTVSQRFVDCDTLELTYAKSGGETGTLTLERGLQRLGDGVCR